MTGTPVISVVMPVWNAGAYLRPAIDSILGQTFADFELIAVDDGSTDGSGAVLAEAAARDHRVRVITQANVGVTTVRNAALERARGRYIALMDADDIAMSDRLARQVARMEEAPDLVALGTQVMLVDPKGRPLRNLALPLNHAEIDAKHMALRGIGLCNPSAMIRKAAFELVGPYRPEFPSAEDFDLWLRLAEVGRVENLETCLLNYRQHLKSVGYTHRHEQNLSAWKAAGAAAARRGLPFDAPAPTPDRAEAVTKGNTVRRWGWWALGGGNVATARRYAAQALVLRPFSADSWRLAYCALRGR